MVAMRSAVTDNSWGDAKMHGMMRTGFARRFAAVLGAAAVTAALVTSAQEVPGEVVRPIGSLKGLQPPLPNLNGFLKDATPETRAAAVALGKALFWDQQAGSDGQACASCHFAAGADTRIRNQLSPGLADMRFTGGDTRFGGLVADGRVNEPVGFTPLADLSPADTDGKTAGGQVAQPNMTVGPGDFPFHQLADPLDRNSAIVYTTNDVMSSQGTFGGAFLSVVPGAMNDVCGLPSGALFHNEVGQPTRKVEPAHTPTVINAAFNQRNFHNGRANNLFNGEDPFGKRSGKAFVVKKTSTGAAKQRIALKDASLASQSVGPPLSDFEMSCAGRRFSDIGRKLLPARALQYQDVAASDSVLYPYVDGINQGLTKTYQELVRAAFHPKYWSAVGRYCRVNGNLVKETASSTTCKTGKGFTQEELNFSMYWGISIMLYEATLVSDDSPLDRFFDGTGQLSDAELRGFALFNGKGNCIACHDGPELTKAASHVGDAARNDVMERMLMAQGNARPALYDNGFYNIGVTPTVAFLGLGGKDPFNKPLSFTRQFLDKTPFATTIAAQNFVDQFKVDPCKFEVLIVGPIETCDPNVELQALSVSGPKNERQAVDGAVKTPTLRNVGLTAPYFHNGGYASLRSVVEFYARGGNRRGNDDPNQVLHDSSGTGPLGRSAPLSNQQVGSNADPDVTSLGLIVDPGQGIDEVGDLVAFLLSLTDQRVACQAGVFDHPSLTVFNGHTDSGPGPFAEDESFILPATGIDGLPDADCLENSGNLF